MALVSGTFGAIATSAAYTSRGNQLGFNAALSGTFSATVQLERSFDSGSTWNVCSNPDLTNAAYTAPVQLTIQDAEPGVLYRWNCTAWASGSVIYRLSP